MRLVIRADGDETIGYGHLIRSGALAAECAERSHEVTFVVAPSTDTSVLPTDGVAVHVLEGEPSRSAFLDWLDSTTVDAVFTDSYDVDTGLQRRIRRSAPVLVVNMDDARYAVAADVIVNGNLYAEDLEYEWIDGQPMLCLGPEYLLLREEICRLAEKDPPWRSPPERAIITMGGSDVRNITATAMRAFEGTSLQVDVVIGPGFQRVEEVVSAARSTDADFRLHRNPPAIGELMFEADFAVSGMGSSTYELLALQTPIIGIVQAANQDRIADAVERHAVATVCRSAATDEIAEAIHTYIDEPSLRRERRQTGRELISTNGTRRVSASIEAAVEGQS